MACKFYIGQSVLITGKIWCDNCSTPTSNKRGTFAGHRLEGSQVIDVFDIEPTYCTGCGMRIGAEKPCEDEGFTHPLFEKVDQPIEREGW